MTNKEKIEPWDIEVGQTTNSLWTGRGQPLLGIAQVVYQRQSGSLMSLRPLPNTLSESVGLLCKEALPCSPSLLFVGNMFTPQWPSLSFPKGFPKGFKTVANKGREGMQRQRRSSLEIIVQPWDRTLVPSQGMHITISLSSSAEIKPHQMEDVNHLMKYSSFQREGHSLIISRTSWGQIKGMQP